MMLKDNEKAESLLKGEREAGGVITFHLDL